MRNDLLRGMIIAEYNRLGYVDPECCSKRDVAAMSTNEVISSKSIAQEGVPKRNQGSERVKQ